MSLCIDCHAHFLPDAFVAEMSKRGFADPRKDEGYIDVSDTLTGYRARPRARLPYFPTLWDIDARVQLAEQQRIDRQLICLPPFYFGYKPEAKAGLEICRIGNDALAEIVAQAPERFSGFATVPLQSPKDAATELRRAVEELDFWGAEIGTNVAGAPLDDPALDVFGRRAASSTFRCSCIPSTSWVVSALRRSICTISSEIHPTPDSPSHV